MSSKMQNKIIVIFSTLLVTSCGLKFGEKKKEEVVAEVAGVSCLTDSTASLKAFVAGNVEEEKLAASFDCLQKVVLSFKDSVRGQNKTAYTPGEIGSFAMKTLFKGKTDVRLDAELLTAIMKFKVALVGGDEKLLTKGEVEEISTIVGKLKPEALRLNPHMMILVGKWAPFTELDLVRESKFISAKLTLRHSLRFVMGILASGGREYKLDDLIDLAYQVAKAAKAEPKTLKLIQDAKPVLTKTKLALVGGANSLQGDEWVMFGATLGELYGQSLRIKYFLKHLTEDQVEEKFAVYEKMATEILGYLPDLLEARNIKAFKTSEIGQMLGSLSLIIEDLKISPELATEVSKLRITLIGKTDTDYTEWSKKDLNKLRDIMPQLMGVVKKVLASLDGLKLKKDEDKTSPVTYQSFLSAESRLLAAGDELADIVKTGYDLRELKKLVEAVAPMLKNAELTPEKLEKLFTLVSAAKYTLTGDPRPEIELSDLKLILKIAARAFPHYVEVVNFIGPYKLEEIDSVNAISLFLPKLRDTLALELELNRFGLIETNQWTQLVLALQKTDFIKTKLKQESLDSLFNALWSNLLVPSEMRIGQKKALKGFDKTALTTLVQEVMVWLIGQKSAHEIFSARGQLTKQEIIQEIDRLSGATKAPLNKLVLSELARVVSANGFMNFSDKGYLKILTEDLNQYHKSDLIKANLSKTLARVIMRSYATDLERIQNYGGIKLEEGEVGYSQLRHFAHDIDLIDRENDGFLASRFRESNLFMSVSNGDEFSSFNEMNNVILHILSGVSRAKDLEVLARQKCLVNDNKEIPSKSEFDEKCLMDLYYDENAAFDFMPEFIKIKTALKEDGQLKYPPEVNKEYYMSLLKAAGHIPRPEDKPKLVFQGDAGLFPHTVQYVEMIFWRYDENRNNLLEKNEGLTAFPVFAKLIEDLTKSFTMTPAEHPGVFIWLLKYGRPPKKLKELQEFSKFIRDHDCADGKPCQRGWDIQTTRQDIGKIFNFIAEATKPKPPPDAPPAAVATETPPNAAATGTEPPVAASGGSAP